MVGKLEEIVEEYEKSLQEMPFVPRASYGSRILREDVGPNRDFLMYLFCDFGFAVQFLKDLGLLRNKVQCNTYGRDMTGPQNLAFLKDLVGDVEGRFLESSVRSRGPLSTAPGSGRVISPSAKFYLSRTTSCAANLPALPEKNMPSVQIPPLTGACSAGKP